MSERIEGEHHYAEVESGTAGEFWHIRRRSDGALVASSAGRDWAEYYIDEADAVANHFIQQGREESEVES